jgi:tRNA modification GTPase
MSDADTIVAIASPPGRGWRGLVRVDGRAEGVGGVIDRWCGAGTWHGLAEREAARVVLSGVGVPAMAVRFARGASYTGNASAEVQAVGHPAVPTWLVESAVASGAARLAEPGEFTYRAFRNGRLSLSAAEGVAATIAADNAAQLRAADRLRHDALGVAAGAVVDELGTLLALVEAGIDFTDQEDVVAIEPTALRRRVRAMDATLAELADGAGVWGPAGEREGTPRVVIVGPPSSGKSTLFNALLGRRRALVDALPGTTRDAIAERCMIEAGNARWATVELIDTAGLDEAMTLATAGLLDRAAQAATRRALDRADLVIRVRDATAGEGGGDREPCSRLGQAEAAMIEVTSKADLRDTGEALCVSAATGLRMDALRSAIVAAVGGATTTGGAAAVALPAHAAAIERARQRLAQAIELAEAEERVAGELRAALDELARLGGELTPDDVVGRVFASFCVGK